MNKLQLTQIVTGIVERIKPRSSEYTGGYATVIVPELGDRQLSVPDNRGPFFVKAGELEPFFTDQPLSKSLQPTDEVVLEVTGVNGAMKVVACGLACFWKKAEEEISRRPIYRVLRDNRFQGQIMCASARGEVFFTGNLKELMAQHPRDGLRVSTVDKLAPVYKTGPATAMNRFEVKQNGADWVSCEDPRPFPMGKTYRVMYWQDGKSEQLAIGSALEINWQFERGDKDPLAKHSSPGESNGYLYFERYDQFIPKGETNHWVEVADPRPAPASKEKVREHEKDSPSAKFEARFAKGQAVAAAARANKPVAMPKRADKPFSTLLNSNAVCA